MLSAKCGDDVWMSSIFANQVHRILGGMTDCRRCNWRNGPGVASFGGLFVIGGVVALRAERTGTELKPEEWALLMPEERAGVQINWDHVGSCAKAGGRRL
jgi:hypothetical protein